MTRAIATSTNTWSGSYHQGIIKVWLTLVFLES